jgi:hypothetical protein
LNFGGITKHGQIGAPWLPCSGTKNHFAFTQCLGGPTLVFLKRVLTSFFTIFKL